MLLFLLLVATCLVMTIATFGAGPTSRIYGNVRLVVGSDVSRNFVDRGKVLHLLGNGGLSPINGGVNSVGAHLLRRRLDRRPLVRGIRYCHAPKYGVNVRIARHLPVLEIVTGGKSGCCVSGGKGVVPVPGDSTRMTIIAKCISHSFTIGRLCALKIFLRTRPL